MEIQNIDEIIASRESFKEAEPAELFKIPNVEIFATGTWNGRKITDSDLTAIVDSYNKTKGTLAPYLKLGHADQQKLLQKEGLPAAGWIENVKKVGSKVVADFVDLPKQIYQLIVNKAYRKVSVELMRDVKFNEQKHPLLLKAVALLGAETPAVMSLKDIMSLYTINEKTLVQHFATDAESFILENEANKIGSNQMTDQERIAELESQLGAEKEKLSALERESADLKFKLEESAKEKAAIEAAKRKTEDEKFVGELLGENILPKSAEAFALELISGEEKEEYSLSEGKKGSRKDLLKEVLKFAQEAAKINFSQTTSGSVEKKSDESDLVEKYAAEHKVSYDVAYRAVINSKTKSQGEE